MNGRGMTGTFQRTTRWRRGVIAAAPFFALLAGGCSGGSFFGAPAGPSAPPPDAAAAPPSGLGRIASFFSGSSAKGPQTVTGAQPDVNCPPVDVRRGASTLTIGPTGDKTAMTLRYQVDFTREARECAVVGGNMVMKVGIEGRVIVGPGGGPGQVDVPLRMALVEETPSGGTHPILTKFILIPVVIAPGQGSTVFTHIEEGVTFPLPTPTAQLDDYLIYIGFDPVSAEAQAKSAPKAKQKPKPQPAASAN
jgi:hypothetical protein